jgi:hypothetical protein
MDTDKHNKTIKTKTNFAIALSVIVFIVLGGIFLLTPISFEQFALALSGNYNRNPAIPADIPLTLTDWNYLDDDFLFKDGSNSMTGDLQMGGNRIYNVSTDPAQNLDAANVGFVNTEIAAATAGTGGDVYTVWGNSTCPNPIYSGVAFSAPYNFNSGGSNPICVQQPGGGGLFFSGDAADKLYPVVTSVNPANLPPGITADSFVRCAVCHSPQSTCYTAFGTTDCNGNSQGFNTVYSGYSLGSSASLPASANSTQRYCVNSTFSSASASNQLGAVWHGTVINNNFGLGFAEDQFITCSVCCN